MATNSQNYNCFTNVYSSYSKLIMKIKAVRGITVVI